MEKVKNITIIVLTLIVMLLLLLKGCNNKETKQNIVKSTYKVDSILHDTVKIADKQIIYKTIYEPKEIVKWKTIGMDSLVSKESNEYSDSVKSNDAITYYKALTLGKLVSLDLSTKLINRKELKTTEYITKENTIIQSPKWSIYPQIGLNGSQSTFGVSGGIGLNINKSSIEAEYDPLNKRISVNIGYSLFKSKK